MSLQPLLAWPVGFRVETTRHGSYRAPWKAAPNQVPASRFNSCGRYYDGSKKPGTMRPLAIRFGRTLIAAHLVTLYLDLLSFLA